MIITILLATYICTTPQFYVEPIGGINVNYTITKVLYLNKQKDVVLAEYEVKIGKTLRGVLKGIYPKAKLPEDKNYYMVSTFDQFKLNCEESK